MDHTQIEVSPKSKHSILMNKRNCVISVSNSDEVISDISSESSEVKVERKNSISESYQKNEHGCSSTKIHGAIRLSSGLLAMIMIVITMVIKLTSALVTTIDKSVEDQYMLALYVTSVAWITGSLIIGRYCNKEMLTWPKSSKSSNRWIKGLIALFGMAIILKDVLLFLSAFHIDMEECDHTKVKGTMYFFHAVFVLAQVTYLFRYAKVFITNCSGGTRMGLMLLIATNLSVWLAAIVDETLIALGSTGVNSTTLNQLIITNPQDKKKSCECHDTFCQAVHIAEKFLFPFMIEFSLVASILLLITWNNAGKTPPPSEGVVKPSYKFYNSYLGACLGGAALVGTVIVIIILGTPTVDKVSTSDFINYLRYLYIHHAFYIALEGCMIGACALGFYYFQLIVRPLEDPLAVDVVLLFICIVGPFTTNIFSLLAVFAGTENRVDGWALTYIQPLIDVTQCMLQLGLILFGLEREPVIHHHHSRKQIIGELITPRLSQVKKSEELVMKKSGDDEDVDSDYCESTFENAGFTRSRNTSTCNVTNGESSKSTNKDVSLPGVSLDQQNNNEGIGYRIFRRIRHYSTTRVFGTEVISCRKRSDDSSSDLSEASVARPDLLRLRLRDVIMFLILTNVCLWILQSLEGTAFSLHTYQSEFYGKSAWTTILMICRPLSIFFRMHSAGCLFEIWSYA